MGKITTEKRAEIKAKHKTAFEIFVPAPEEYTGGSAYVMETVRSETFEEKGKPKDGEEKKTFEFSIPYTGKEAGLIAGLKKTGDTKEVGATFVFRQPSRKVISAATKLAKDDGVKLVEVIMKNTIVWGDKKLLEDDDFFFPLSDQMEKVVARKTASIKKL